MPYDVYRKIYSEVQQCLARWSLWSKKKNRHLKKGFCLYRISFVWTEIYNLSLPEFNFCYYEIQKKKKKLLQPFHSDDGCFGLIGDQIAPFTIYFFRNWQYLCVFLSSCPRSLVFLLWQTRSLRLQSAWRWSYKITSRLSLKSLRLRARNTLLNR